MRSRSMMFVVALLVVAAASPSFAIAPFYKAFKAQHLDKLEDKTFAEEVDKETNRCFVCHQGKSKKNRNAFGVEVGKLLTKKDKDNTAKIEENLKKALEMHVDPKDPKSETYMDRLKAGKWPVGTLEELKKEPEKKS